mgnify:FL=1
MNRFRKYPKIHIDANRLHYMLNKREVSHPLHEQSESESESEITSMNIDSDQTKGIRNDIIINVSESSGVIGRAHV